MAEQMGVNNATTEGASNWFGYKYDSGVSNADDFKQFCGIATLNAGSGGKGAPEAGRCILVNIGYNAANIVQLCFVISGDGAFYNTYSRAYHHTNGWSVWKKTTVTG